MLPSGAVSCCQWTRKSAQDLGGSQGLASFCRFVRFPAKTPESVNAGARRQSARNPPPRRALADFGELVHEQPPVFEDLRDLVRCFFVAMVPSLWL